MKRKIEIYNEMGLDENGHPIPETIKRFKNETDAMAFYRDWKNYRRYGTMYMKRDGKDGGSEIWDDRKEEWVTV